MQRKIDDVDHLFHQLTNSAYLYHHPFKFGETLYDGPKVVDGVFCLLQTKMDSSRGGASELILHRDLPTFLMKGFKGKILDNDAAILKKIGFTDEQINVVEALPVHTDIRTNQPFADGRFLDCEWFTTLQVPGQSRIVAASGDLALHVTAPNLEGESILLFQRDAGAPSGAYGWVIGGGLCDEPLANKAFSELGEENSALQFEWDAGRTKLTVRPIRFVLSEEEVPEIVITNDNYKSCAEKEIKRLYGKDVAIEWGEPVLHELEIVPLADAGHITVTDENGAILETVPGRVVWQPELTTLSYQLGARLGLDLPVADIRADRGVILFDQEFGRINVLFYPGMDLQGKPNPDALGGFERGQVLPFTVPYINGFFGNGTAPTADVSPSP